VVLQWCYSGVTVVLQCYSGVTVLEWCFNEVAADMVPAVAATLTFCCNKGAGVTVVLQCCYIVVTVALQWYHSGVTVLLQWFHTTTFC
jgi:hypothetical protein